MTCLERDDINTLLMNKKTRKEQVIEIMYKALRIMQPNDEKDIDCCLTKALRDGNKL